MDARIIEAGGAACLEIEFLRDHGGLLVVPGFCMALHFAWDRVRVAVPCLVSCEIGPMKPQPKHGPKRCCRANNGQMHGGFELAKLLLTLDVDSDNFCNCV